MSEESKKSLDIYYHQNNIKDKNHLQHGKKNRKSLLRKA